MLLPHEIKAGSVIEWLAGVGKQVFAIVGEHGEEAAFIFCGTGNVGLAGDPNVFGGVHQGDAKASDLVDQAERKGLLAGPYLPGGEGLDLVVGGMAAGSDVVDELTEHVIDKRLEVGLLLRGNVAAGIARVL